MIQDQKIGVLGFVWSLDWRKTICQQIDSESARIYYLGSITWLLTFLAFVIVFWPMRHLPYWWDAMGYVQNHSEEIYKANLFPILRNYDVGHPTFFYFVVAVFMKLVGNGPLAGHLATWAVCAVLPGSIYALARSLQLPRALSALAAVLFLTTPLVWSSLVQVLLDLPLTALTLCSFAFWCRGRFFGYFIFGSAAVLTKIYGFTIVFVPLGGYMLTGGFPWKVYKDKQYIKTIIWTLAPLLSLSLFMILRYLVRGPGVALNFQQVDELSFLWNLDVMFERSVSLYKYSIVLTNNHYVMFAVGILMGLLAAKSLFFWLRGKEIMRMSKDELIVLLLLIFWCLGTGLLLLQVRNYCCPRYAMYLFFSMCIFSVYILWRVVGNQYIVMGVMLVLLFCHVILWHPRHASVLRPPLDEILEARDPGAGWNYELDLQVLDPIALISKAADVLIQDHQVHNSNGKIATGWPVDGTLTRPALGYVERALPVVNVGDWSQVDLKETKYLVELPPIYQIGGTPPPGVHLVEIYRETRCHCSVIVWLLENES